MSKANGGGKRERALLVGAVTVGACGASVKIKCKCLEPVAAAEGVDVLGVLDRHAREVLNELTGGGRPAEGGAE